MFLKDDDLQRLMIHPSNPNPMVKIMIRSSWNFTSIFFLFVLFMTMKTFFGQKALGAQSSDTNEKRPNILIIYSDDQSIKDLGIYGGEDIYTPHTDALGEKGVRFTQMYAPSSICSPSRAGLLTGRYPQRAGLPGNASAPPVRGIDDGEGAPGLSSDQPSMGNILRDAGYRTAMIGKWHLGYNPGYRPDDHGFEYWFGHLGGAIDNYSHFFYWSGPNRHDLWRNGERVLKPGNYFPDLMLEEAKHFIAGHQHDPFFLYYSLNTPHYPYQSDPHWIEHYEQEEVGYPRDLYGAFVTAQDERIGLLMDFLKENNLIDNTIIIFQADNGHSVEERAHFGGGNAGKYRGAKRGLFEGGIRVPAIISWPGVVPENQVRDQMAQAMDWLPTLAEWLDISLPVKEFDGKSLTGVIASEFEEEPHDMLFWERTYRNQWVVRKGAWKLYANAFDQPGMQKLTEQDRKLFLANLEKDPGETTNLVHEYPEIVRELKELYKTWQQEN